MNAIRYIILLNLFISQCIMSMYEEPKQLSYQEKVKALKKPDSDEFLIKNIYLKSSDDIVGKTDSDHIIEMRVLAQSRRVVDFLYDWKNSIKDEKINDELPFINVVCSDENVPALIRALQDNYYLNERQEPISGDLQNFDLKKIIDLTNAFEDLDLESFYKKSGSFPEARNLLDARIENIKPNEYALLYNLNPHLIERIIFELIKDHKIDTVLFELYSKKLYEQKIKLSLSNVDQIYYYSENFIVYKSADKIYIKKDNELPVLIYSIDRYYSSDIGFQEEVYVNTNESFFIFLDERKQKIIFGKTDQKKDFIKIPGNFTAGGFVSNDVLYLGNEKGKLYQFTCNSEVSNNNPSIIKAQWDEENKSAIKGFVTSKDYNKLIVYKSDKEHGSILYEMILSTTGLLCKKLPINFTDRSKDPNYRSYGTIAQASINPNQEILAVFKDNSWAGQKVSLYDFKTSKEREIEYSTGINYAGGRLRLCWINNNLLVTKRHGYIKFINIYSNDMWSFEIISPDDFWDNLIISKDGTKVIETEKRWLGFDVFMRKLFDDNMQKTFDFFSSHSKNLNYQLIVIALLNQLIKNNIQRKPFTGELEEVYNDLPEAVKNIWELNVPVIKEEVKDTSIISSIGSYFNWQPTLKRVKETLYNYRYQLGGVAALGLAAAYKYWTTQKTGEQ